MSTSKNSKIAEKFNEAKTGHNAQTGQVVQIGETTRHENSQPQERPSLIVNPPAARASAPGTNETSLGCPLLK